MLQFAHVIVMQDLFLESHVKADKNSLEVSINGTPKSLFGHAANFAMFACLMQTHTCGILPKWSTCLRFNSWNLVNFTKTVRCSLKKMVLASLIDINIFRYFIHFRYFFYCGPIFVFFSKYNWVWSTAAAKKCHPVGRNLVTAATVSGEVDIGWVCSQSRPISAVRFRDNKATLFFPESQLLHDVLWGSRATPSTRESLLSWDIVVPNRPFQWDLVPGWQR